MNIYLKVEIKNREFLSKLLLGMYSAFKGNDVFIGDDRLLKYVENGSLKPGIILEKSITPSSSRIQQLKKYKKNKCVVFSLDEENGLLSNNFESFAKSRFSNQTISLTDKILCWGKYDYRHLIKKYKKYKKKFVTTGNPRVDLWKTKYNKLFYNKKIKEKNCIFVSSNFVVGNSSKRFTDIIRDNYISSGYFKDKKFKSYFYDFHASFNFRLMIEFVKLIEFLTSKYPKINLVLRPHPMETVESWSKMLEKKNNLIISKKYDYSSWILNSDLIIHNGCLGGVEAFARSKNVVAYRPIKHKQENKFANSLSNNLYNYSQIDKLIKKIFIKKNKNSKIFKSSSFINRFGNLKEKTTSYEKIYKEFEKFNSKKINEKNNLSKIFVKGKLRPIKNIFSKTYVNEKFPKITKKELENNLIKLKKCSKNFKYIKYKILDDNLIKLYSLASNK